AIRGPISAHEALDQDVEFGLTLIAFGWRAHPRAPFGDGPTRTDLYLLHHFELNKASPRGTLIQIKIQQMPAFASASAGTCDASTVRSDDVVRACGSTS